MKKSHRFVHYTSSEIVALALDLVLLWIMVYFFEIHYLIAGLVAYLIAMTSHYHTVRKHIFHSRLRDPFHKYAYFNAVGIVGLITTLAIMNALISIVHTEYVVARMAASVLIIPLTYQMNKIFTFKMPKALPSQKDAYCNIPDDRLHKPTKRRSK